MKRRNIFDIINKYVIFNSQNIKKDEKKYKKFGRMKKCKLRAFATRAKNEYTHRWINKALIFFLLSIFGKPATFDLLL